MPLAAADYRGTVPVPGALSVVASEIAFARKWEKPLAMIGSGAA